MDDDGLYEHGSQWHSTYHGHNARDLMEEDGYLEDLSKFFCVLYLTRNAIIQLKIEVLVTFMAEFIDAYNKIHV
jgi:hypothetical protein